MGARVCPNCGHPLSVFARFCPSCGSDVADAPTLTVTQTIEPPPEADPSVRWRALEGFPVFFLSLLAGGIGLTGILAVFVDGQNALRAGAVLAQEVVLLLTVLTWVRLRHGSTLSDLGVRDLTAQNLGVGLAAGVLGIITSIVVGGILLQLIEAFTDRTPPAPEQIPLEGTPSSAVLAVIGISVIIFAPLAEELFFRGFLYRAYRRWAMPWTAVLLSAVIFAVVHVQWQVIPSIFALGILLAWVTEWRRTIVPAIVAHMTFNIFGFIFFAMR